MVVVAETLVDARLVGASPMRRCGISSIRTSSIQVPSASASASSDPSLVRVAQQESGVGCDYAGGELFEEVGSSAVEARDVGRVDGDGFDVVETASIPFSECRCGGRVEFVYDTLSPCRVWPTCGSVIDMVASMKSEPVACYRPPGSSIRWTSHPTSVSAGGVVHSYHCTMRRSDPGEPAASASASGPRSGGQRRRTALNAVA